MTFKGKSATRLTSSKATAWGGWGVGCCCCFFLVGWFWFTGLLACLFVYLFSPHIQIWLLRAAGCRRFSFPLDRLQQSASFSSSEGCSQSWEGTWVLPSPGFMLASCPVLFSQRLSSLSPGNAMLENSRREAAA